jgi:hypothetical protein
LLREGILHGGTIIGNKPGHPPAKRFRKERAYLKFGWLSSATATLGDLVHGVGGLLVRCITCCPTPFICDPAKKKGEKKGGKTSDPATQTTHLNECLQQPAGSHGARGPALTCRQADMISQTTSTAAHDESRHPQLHATTAGKHNNNRGQSCDALRSVRSTVECGC